MLNACVLVKVIPTKIVRVVEEIQKLRGVRRSFMVFGRFDVVAFVEAQDYSGIREISESINRLEGVRSTETLVQG